LERILKFLKSSSLWATAVKIILYVALMFFLVILPERPHNYKVLSVIILIGGIFFVFIRLKRNKKYSGDQYLRLRHENDAIEKIMSLSVGILLIIGSFWYIIVAEQFAGGTLMCALLGLFFLFNGMTYKHTVILKKDASKITQINDPEIQIDKERISKLTIHLNQIIAEKGSEDTPLKIEFLEIKDEEIGAIKKWFSEFSVSV
jgi:predicted neutral ceramidase superfamily lipid hydrolase